MSLKSNFISQLNQPNAGNLLTFDQLIICIIPNEWLQLKYSSLVLLLMLT